MKNSRALLLVPTILSSLLASACVEGDLDSSLGQGQAAVINGNPISSDPAVALLLTFYTDGTNSLCSGSLIAPKVILTAGHCLELPEGKTVQNYYAYFGDNALNSDPNGNADQIDVINIVDAIRPAEFDITKVTSGYDIALLELERASTLEPVPFNRKALDAELGQPLRIVGWGVNAIDGQGQNGSGSGIKREGFATLQELAQPHLIRFTSIDTNGCRGDSGGPQFMFIDGEEVIVSVNSFGDTPCVSYNYGTRVDLFASYVDEFVAARNPPTCEADFRCVEGCQDPDCGSVDGDGDGDGDGGGNGDGSGGGNGDGSGGGNGDGSGQGKDSQLVTGGCAAGGSMPSALMAFAFLLLLGRIRERRTR